MVFAGLALAATTNCSSEDGSGESTSVDAGVDTSNPSADAGTPDAESSDAESSEHDSAPAPFDGGPLPIVCTSPPCAKSLVTTLGRDANDFGEGYCALLDDGTVACWGANGAAQLGRGDDAGLIDDTTAARVVGLSDVVRLDHTCALDTAGAIRCWGTGPFLRDRSGARTTERTPFQLPLGAATRVALGETVACAVVEGNVTCWGANTNAQLSPFSVEPANSVIGPTTMALPNGAPIRDIVVTKASFVVREDGEVLSWGADLPVGRVTSLKFDPYPRALAIEDISSLDLARETGCATALGVGYCWGNIVGGTSSLDTAMRLDRALPEPIAAPEPLVQIATTTGSARTVGSDWIVAPQRWCAVSASGAVHCSGYNASGQAGDGTNSFVYQATKVMGLPAPAVQVKTMTDSTCALLTSGKVYCWGSNYYGQLGSGQLKARSLVPQEVILP